jgi:hypothetical protein
VSLAPLVESMMSRAQGKSPSRNDSLTPFHGHRPSHSSSHPGVPCSNAPLALVAEAQSLGAISHLRIPCSCCASRLRLFHGAFQKTRNIGATSILKGIAILFWRIAAEICLCCCLLRWVLPTIDLVVFLMRVEYQHGWLFTLSRSSSSTTGSNQDIFASSVRFQIRGRPGRHST